MKDRLLTTTEINALAFKIAERILPIVMDSINKTIIRKEDKRLNAEEAAKILKISVPALRMRYNRGQIKVHRDPFISGKNSLYFLESEILPIEYGEKDICAIK